MNDRILVVDDEPSVLAVCRGFLESRNYTVDTASNAELAMALFEPGRFNLVITDINMPSISGVELARWIKELEPEIPVIILTGYGSYDLMHKALRGGVSDFIEKPFLLETLQRSVEKALEHREYMAERERLRIMRRLITATERIAREVNEFSLLQYLSECAATETGARIISVMLPDGESGSDRLRIAIIRGISGEIEEAARQTEAELAQSVFETRAALRVEDICRETGLGAGPRYSHYKTHSFMSIPLVIGSMPMGVLNLTDKSDGKSFSRTDEEVAVILANHAAIALERVRLYDRLQLKIEETESMFYGVVQAISNAIDAKSPWTKGHSERVTIYAGMIGSALGLSERDMDTLTLAALLHDVGKIGTYDTLLDKPARLTDNEYEMVKLHPVKGENILKPIVRLSHILPIIRHHHERFDGRGYPDGLSGQGVPFLARVLTVADTFDSMTSQRPYRDTPGRDKGISELHACAGTQFDPEIVDAFILALRAQKTGAEADKAF